MQQPEEITIAPPISKQRAPWVWDLILIGILILGAYFRFSGVNWDDETHMHPDERFMTMVASSISPVDGIGAYFDTNQSALNPNNVGYGFYVYGTLPLFIVRYAAELVHQSGYGEIQIVGRQLSALVDLGTVLLVYLIAMRVFRKPRIGLLAAAFYAMAVLPIQLSHYFKEDTFVAFFSTLAVYFALRILPLHPSPESGERAFRPWADLAEYLLFALAFGMALASKISIAPLALLLPLAAAIWLISAPPQRREQLIWPLLAKLALAGLFALLVFRICQPYAFSGPGFFGVVPNPRWVQNMREIAAQNSGDIDFPPQLQWARRPLWFSLQNQVVYGLGTPLGVAAWLAFLAMGWRIVRGSAEERRRYLLIWLWTGAYFAWQSISVTRTMRYQMPTYALLTVIAAWGLFALHEWGKTRLSWQRILAGVAGVSIVISTAIWAYAFLGIYIRPFTRAEASRWIYQNVPGPVNVRIETGQGEVNQPLSFNHGYVIQPRDRLRIAFTAQTAGELQDVTFDHVVDEARGTNMKSLVAVVEPLETPGQILGYGLVNDVFGAEDDSRGRSVSLAFSAPVPLEAGKTYALVLELGQDNASLKLSGSILLALNTGSDRIYQPLPEPEEALTEGGSMGLSFIPVQAGTVRRIYVNRLVDWEANPGVKRVKFTLTPLGGESTAVGSGQIEGAFVPGADTRGQEAWVALDPPVTLEPGQTYSLSMQFLNGPGRLAIYGSKHANETTWDDALPLGVDGYDPYGYNTGIYRTDLNFEMYWDDNAEKLDRFLSTLEQADYIFISSNRQWGTTTRVPERYPLTTLYYRSLLGCPDDKDIYWCYAVAQPGQFTGALGFSLVHTVQSEPTFGPIQVNTQFAEEAFTVYDHPKVLIFKKTAAYDRDQVRALLKTVDLSMVVHLTPAKAGSYVGNLMLPAGLLAVQRAGGTWAQLFDRAALQNRFPGLGVVVWYLTISLLSWLVYPIVRLALRGLPDRGYPLARLVGMLLLAYPVWLLGSAGIPFERLTITLVALALVLTGMLFAWLQRRELASELREKWRYFLAVEGIALAFFLLFLLVRLGNGDIWHPWKGGEKPMDFSYFNAVLKSTVFPPYDPWLAGGYINYYYYGFVLVGVPVKWLGIVPSIAYNLILPQLFSMLALGGFSVAWNILAAAQSGEADRKTQPFGGGLTAAMFLVVLGNLGTVRMIWHGLMRLAAPAGDWVSGNIFQRIGWTFGGLVRFLGGNPLPYPPGDWYWIPSRALPSSAGDPITEFPAFTFLYADLHAHMIALPLTVLGLSWALSIVLGQWRWGMEDGRLKGLHFISSFALAGLAIGVLRPTNTWDFPTYLALGSVAVLFAVFRDTTVWTWKTNLPGWFVKAGTALVGVGLLAGLAVAFYQPFAHWYGQAYNSIKLWENGHSPTWSYLTHWGLFLFMIVTFLFIETIDWMAKTPLSALNKLRPHLGLIWAGAALVVVVTGVLLLREVWIAWMVFPLMAWAAVLLLRPGMSASRRALLFIIGTGLVLTLLVEIVVLVGDINRMNTVFKFYLQAWVLLGIAAAVSLAWVFNDVERFFTPIWRAIWHTAAAVLIGGALLFPLLAGADKIRDRISFAAPHTLDGMTYMATSTYNENETQMDLSEDYRAILWMQQNVAGSPVIVEGSVGEYRWGNRYTINTGLPSVVGWNWHQRQQRAVTPETWVTSRVAAVGDFYTLPDLLAAQQFLQRYEVSYIVVGQMERAIYPVEGLAKFETENGRLWDEIYRDGQTVIYKVR